MKNIKKLCILLVLPLLCVSCLVDDTNETGLEYTPYIVGFNNGVAAESYFADEGVVLANYKINILGGNGAIVPTQDITISYIVDAVASTAVEGVEFDFVSNTGTVVIPAGSTFTDFPLNINTGNFDPTAPTILRLTLTATGDDGSVVSSIHDTLDVTFVGCQADLNLYTYSVVTTRLTDNLLVNNQTESIAITAVNNFRSQTVGQYGPGTLTGPIGGENGYDFFVICGEVTIPSQNLVNLYSNQVFGAGSVDIDTGTMTNIFTITFSAGNRQYRSVYTRQ
jgi:hypothetical protein